MSSRLRLSQCGLAAGKRARMHRILYQHGLGNGTALFLPYDQGLEHGPRDFFADPIAADPRYIIRLALEGGFNGIAVQIGLAEKFYWDYAGEVPLILKLNGKTDIPSDERALSSLHASVEDAVRLGADAVGYTLYVGSPAQDADFAQYRTVRQDAQRLGMPLIVWAYPRGEAIEHKGGKDSFYAVHYAARVASERSSAVTCGSATATTRCVSSPSCGRSSRSTRRRKEAVMKALVVYESMFGNTEAIARAVAERLEMNFDVIVAEVNAMPTARDADLLVVGAPTHAFSLSRPRTRADAARHGTVKAGAAAVGIREYLDCSPRLTEIHAAAFDTKVKKPALPGSAARKAYRRLRRLGCHMVTDAMSFHVTDMTGPLVDGEQERARRWADLIAATVLAGRRSAPTT